MGWTVWTPHGKTGLYFFYIYCHCLYGIQKTISGFPSQNLGTQIREGGRELAKYFLNEWKNILLSMLPPYPKWMCCSNSKQVPPLPWVPLSPLLPVCASCPSLALQFICSHTPFSQLAYSAWMPHNSSSFLLSSFNWNIALIPLQSNSAYPVSSCPRTPLTYLAWVFCPVLTCHCTMLPVFIVEMSANDKRNPGSYFFLFPKVHVVPYLEYSVSIINYLVSLPLLTWEDFRKM